MEQITMAARLRTATGSRSVRRLRRDGKLPAIVYGRQFGDPLGIEIDAREFRDALQGHSSNSIFNLEIEGRATTQVLLHERQHDPVTNRLQHVDFHAVRMDEQVEADVPLTIVGSAPGVKEGGVLDVVLREITIESLPASIPDHIEVDVGALNIGDNIHVRDLRAPEGVRIVQEGDEIVLSLLAPAKAEVPATLAEPTGTEPELVGKKPAEGAA
jgi:large subunit ribosomal protein L25